MPFLRILVAEPGCNSDLINIQAGESMASNLDGFRSDIRTRIKALAASERKTLRESVDLLNTATGTIWNNDRHSFHPANSIRLSAPIIQTNLTCGRARFKRLIVSTVYTVFNSFSKLVTSMRVCCATPSAFEQRTSKGAIPARCFRGFCGDTSHQTRSRFNLVKAN